MHTQGVPFLLLTPMRWPRATEIPIMAAGEPKVCRLSMDAKTQSTSCSVRINSTATAWPVDVLLWTWAERKGVCQSGRGLRLRDSETP